jgi:AcrR family transcriptional regulator
MADPYDPRANQKQRTRAAIVEAAAQLLRGGIQTTVASAAEAAKVSRATAYRYFPTPESLLLEVTGISPAYEPVEQLLTTLKGDDGETRLAKFLELVNDITFAEEPRMRMALKVYLDTWFADRSEGTQTPPVRAGRRMRWLDAALEPALGGLKKAQKQRLQAAIALTVGADAMVIMKDVCKLDDREAKDVLLWTARIILRAGLMEMQQTGMPRKR